jgi:hypothetical protein
MNIQNHKALIPFFFGKKVYRVESLTIGFWNLFVFWSLSFGIYSITQPDNFKPSLI